MCSGDHSLSGGLCLDKVGWAGEWGGEGQDKECARKKKKKEDGGVISTRVDFFCFLF